MNSATPITPAALAARLGHIKARMATLGTEMAELAAEADMIRKAIGAERRYGPIENWTTIVLEHPGLSVAELARMTGRTKVSTATAMARARKRGEVVAVGDPLRHWTRDDAPFGNGPEGTGSVPCQDARP